MSMPIAYAINDGYTKPLMAQLVALFEQAHPSTVYDIYILNYGLSEKNRSRLIDLVATLKAEAKVIFLDIDDSYNEQIPLVGVWGRETNYRGLLAELLPNLERILYLDADTMVLGDLSHLMQINLEEAPFAAAADIVWQHQNILKIASIDQNLVAEKQLFTFGYINAGIMLINLHYWRQHNWTHQFLRLLNLAKQITPAILPDQDVLNYMAIKDGINRIYYLPTTYNSLYTHAVSTLADNKVATGLASKVDELWTHAQMHRRNQWVHDVDKLLIFDKVLIIHFCSQKPWG
jgi:lipopolysaccharide biosynthesis glycosyltransferase